MDCRNGLPSWGIMLLAAGAALLSVALLSLSFYAGFLLTSGL